MSVTSCSNLSARALSICYQPIEALVPYKRNARTHSKQQLRQIAESIRTFGFTNPILIDAENTIIAGHGRSNVAGKNCARKTLPAIVAEPRSISRREVCFSKKLNVIFVRPL